MEIERQRDLLLQTVAALAQAVEVRDCYTGGHTQRVTAYALLLAENLKLSAAEKQALQLGVPLHDVGKIGIPDEVLRKPRQLTVAEERLMQTHTVLGEQMLAGIGFLQGEGLRVVRSHHERWDGRGYPDGLARDAIPLGARIFAVADALDAITSTRPYRDAGSWTAARMEIVGGAHTQFDPDLVDAFREREGALAEIRRELWNAA